MCRFRQIRLASLSTLLLALLPLLASAQSLLPTVDGAHTRFTASIETPRAYVSGMCVVMLDGNMMKASMFNEFGITALNFTYQPDKGKVKLIDVLPMLNKWYIKRTLKGDIKHLMKALEQGDTTYVNQRRHITYTFVPYTGGDDDINLSDEDDDYDLTQ